MTLNSQRVPTPSTGELPSQLQFPTIANACHTAEIRPPEAGAQVRILPGALAFGLVTCALIFIRRRHVQDTCNTKRATRRPYLSKQGGSRAPSTTWACPFC